MTPTGYLDTNLFIGLVKRDLKPAEQEALERLLDFRESGAINLYRSRRTDEEIANCADDEARAPEEEMLRRFEAVPEAGEYLVIGMLGTSRALRPVPGIQDADLASLRSMMRDDYDARHLFQAIRNGVDYFVTADVDAIVKRAGEIEAKFPTIRILTPSQLVAALDTMAAAS